MQIHGTRYIRHKKRPGIITGALPFRYRNERKPKLAPYGDENTKDNKNQVTNEIRLKRKFPENNKQRENDV